MKTLKQTELCLDPLNEGIRLSSLLCENCNYFVSRGKSGMVNCKYDEKEASNAVAPRVEDNRIKLVNGHKYIFDWDTGVNNEWDVGVIGMWVRDTECFDSNGIAHHIKYCSDIREYPVIKKKHFIYYAKFGRRYIQRTIEEIVEEHDKQRELSIPECYQYLDDNIMGYKIANDNERLRRIVNELIRLNGLVSR